jgi:hypothetical protein
VPPVAPAPSLSKSRPSPQAEAIRVRSESNEAADHPLASMKNLRSVRVGCGYAGWAASWLAVIRRLPSQASARFCRPRHKVLLSPTSSCAPCASPIGPLAEWRFCRKLPCSRLRRGGAASTAAPTAGSQATSGSSGAGGAGATGDRGAARPVSPQRRHALHARVPPRERDLPSLVLSAVPASRRSGEPPASDWLRHSIGLGSAAPRRTASSSRPARGPNEPQISGAGVGSSLLRGNKRLRFLHSTDHSFLREKSHRPATRPTAAGTWALLLRFSA